MPLRKVYTLLAMPSASMPRTLTKKTRSDHQVAPHQSIYLSISWLNYSAPAVRMSTSRPKMAYNSGNTANTMVVPKAL